jgi:hypothetical protein
MSKDKTKDKDKGKKDKGKKDKAAKSGGDKGITLASHPKAAGSIRRTKARGGIAGFLIGFIAAWQHGGTIVSELTRGLEGGVIAWLVCWFAAVTIWRHVINAELRAAIAKRKAAQAAAAAASK